MSTGGELRTTLTSTVNGDSGIASTTHADVSTRPSSPTHKESTTRRIAEVKSTEKPSTSMKSIEEKKPNQIAPIFQKLKGCDTTAKNRDREQKEKIKIKSTVKEKITKPKNMKNEEAAKNITKMKAYWSKHVTKRESSDNIMINNVPKHVTSVPECSKAKQDITIGENKVLPTDGAISAPKTKILVQTRLVFNTDNTQRCSEERESFIPITDGKK